MQHPVFYRPDALPVAQPTVSEHWWGTQCTTTHTLIRHRFSSLKHIGFKQLSDLWKVWCQADKVIGRTYHSLGPVTAKFWSLSRVWAVLGMQPNYHLQIISVVLSFITLVSILFQNYFIFVLPLTHRDYTGCPQKVAPTICCR